MEIVSGIYCITNIINNKKYIGLSSNIYRRWGEHRRVPFNESSKEYNYPLYRAIRKYGLENFKFEIIEQCSDEKKLLEKEAHWIKYYDSINKGYNITAGGEHNTLRGEQHSCAKLTEKDVIYCRQEYAKGKRSREIYDRYYSEVLTYNSFQKMWHGITWKHIMPEVFNNNPHPRQKAKEQDILDMRTKYFEGVPMKDIKEQYKDLYSPSTVRRILLEKSFCPELWPNIEDHHINLRQKITKEDILLIRELKSQGYLHKDIQKALNNKVSMTTISDIVTGKRYSDIK